MKVEREDGIVAPYEGGEEAPAEEEKKGPKSRRDHYMEKHPDFKATDSGINEETGLNYQRSCTDFICVVFFLVFVSCMFAVAIFGLIKGEPARLFAPYDSLDRFCGVDESVKEYPYLFLTNFQPTYADAWAASQEDYETIYMRIFYKDSICVKECLSDKVEKLTCPPDAPSQAVCDNAEYYNTDFKGYSMLGICFPDYDKMPDGAKKNWDQIINGLKGNPIFLQAEYLASTWKALLFSVLTSLILAIIYIYLMSLLAEYVAWALIFLVQIGLIVLAVGGVVYYTQATSENKGMTSLVVGIISAIFAMIFAVAVYCGWNQLKMSIEIINCSADFLASTKRLIGVPFIYFIFIFLFFMFWMASMISVESMGNIRAATDPAFASEFVEKKYLPLDKRITWDDRKQLGKTVNLMMAFLTFGLIWFTFFMDASNNYVTMVTASTFYFSSNRHKWGSGEVGTAFRWAWVHNFGSIAFGSLIIAIIWTIRMMVYYVCKKAEKSSGDSGVVKAITCVAMCLLKCLEEIMEYINRAAYAYMAISGESFCQSALHGLLLQLKRGAAFAFANLLAQMFILLGKVGLTVVNVVIVYFYLKATAPPNDPSDVYAPLAIVAFATLVLVSIFLGMFDESVVAMMTCLSADLDLHDGDNIWGPASLHKVIDDINGVEGSEEGEQKDKSNDMN